MGKLFVAIALGYDGAKRVYPGQKVMLEVDKAPKWALTEDDYAEREAGLVEAAAAEETAAVTKGLEGNLPGQAPQSAKPKAARKPKSAKAKPAKAEEPAKAPAEKPETETKPSPEELADG